MDVHALPFAELPDSTLFGLFNHSGGVMPTIYLCRDNAWEFWKTGRVAAANVEDLAVDATTTTSILNNLSVKSGYNAIRLWLNWSSLAGMADYSLMAEDWQEIAWSGWSSQAITKRSQLLYDQDTNTVKSVRKVAIYEVGNRIDEILDKCRDLGIGVIFTGDFCQRIRDDGTLGRLWQDNPNPDPLTMKGRVEYMTTATTAAGMHGVLGLFWQNTIKRFASKPALIGMDILNEPEPLKDVSLAVGRDKNRFDSWARVAQYLVAVIRQVDPSSATGAGSAPPKIPLIIQGVNEYDVGLNLFANVASPSDTSFLVRDYTFGSNNAPNLNRTDDRIVYSLHHYGAPWISGQGVTDQTYLAMGSAMLYTGAGTPYATLNNGTPGGSGGMLARTWGNVNGTKTAAALDYVGQATWDAMLAPAVVLKNLGYPIFVGEFSCVQPNLSQLAPVQPGQIVSNAPPVSATADPTKFYTTQQITSITHDTQAHNYIFGLANIADAYNWQPVDLLSEEQVLNDTTYANDSYRINPVTRYPQHYNNGVAGTDVPIANWRSNWFANKNLLATVYQVNGAAINMTPICQDVPITIAGSYLNPLDPNSNPGFKVPDSLMTTLVSKVDRGVQDSVSKKYPVVAILTVRSAIQPNITELDRTVFLAYLLRQFQSKGFNWAYHAEDINQAGFVGWRPNSGMRNILRLAARGEMV